MGLWIVVWVLLLCVSVYPTSRSSLLYIEVWKIRWKIASTKKKSFEALIKITNDLLSDMVIVLWRINSNAFLVWRNISAGRVVILVLLQRHKQSNGGSGYTVRTDVLCQRSCENKHPMLSKQSLLHSFSLLQCLGVIKSITQPLKL